jgi:hypothetical protein
MPGHAGVVVEIVTLEQIFQSTSVSYAQLLHIV